ncbi:MAG TPA: hypothetical protein VFA46_06140 [Actinomycetes bacterium]|jgi:hypothetical protein|nr:hypothetical protein [Actinomycetes bacterium]
MDRVSAVPAGELRLDQRVITVLPLAGQRWLVQCSDAGELLVVDAQLEPLWRLSVPAGWRGTHAVADDLSLVALSLRDHVLLLDHSGHQVARFGHHPWGNSDSELGCCVFAPDGRHLWATVPTWSPEQPLLANDELWLIDLTAWAVRDRRKLNVAAAGSTPLRHPDGHTVGLAIGEGQDGARIRWARPARGKIALRAAPSYDRILVDIRQSGGEYLTTPHSQGVDELCRHRFADDQPVDRLPPPANIDPGGHWGHKAGYLTDELVLAHITGSRRHVLIQREPLRVLATIAYPDGDTPGWWCVTGQSAWLTIGPEGIQRWVLPPLRDQL